ncbi:MAG: FxsA family protein [Egibacteraceae bacterium]
MPLLVLAFIVIPLVELYVIIQVGQVIGALPTIVLLLFVSITGAWLCKREGLRAWKRFRAALDEPRIPTEEVVDGALVLFGGALMLTPGFLTDIVGLLLVLPPTRALANRLIRTRVRLSFGLIGPPRRRPVRRPEEPVDVEVVQIKRSEPTDH